jgi:hypothetical protein
MLIQKQKKRSSPAFELLLWPASSTGIISGEDDRRPRNPCCGRRILSYPNRALELDMHEHIVEAQIRRHLGGRASLETQPDAVF